MKPFSGLLLIICVIPVFSGLSTGQTADTDDNKLSINVTSDFNSRYVWRGYTFSEGNVIQPSATFTFRKFSFNVWSNFDLEKNEDSPALNEYDIIFYYSYERNNLEIQPFIQFYIYPGTEEPSTGELTLNAAYTYKNLKLFTSHNIDFFNYKGAYYGNAGAGFESEIYRNIFFDCSVYIGWANSKFNTTYGNVDKSTINHFCGNFGFTYYPAEIFYTKARFEISNLLDRHLRESNTNQPIINWGISLGMEL